MNELSVKIAAEATNQPDLYSLNQTPPTLHKKKPVIYASVDECINDSYASELCPLTSLIQGHRKRNKKAKSQHVKPLAFVRFNTSRGKPKPTTLRALLDSGGSETIVSSQFVKKLKVVKDSKGATTWATPA